METLEEEIKGKILAGKYDYPVMMTIGALVKIVPGIQEAVDERKKIEEEARQAEIELIRGKNLSDILENKNEVIPLVELERLLIIAALKKTKGNTEQAAKELGISERTLFRKYIEYGINHKEFEEKEEQKEKKNKKKSKKK